LIRHVLEHTRDPIGFLQQQRILLKPGGRMVVEVPDYESVWNRVFKRNSEHGHALPFHLYHFTRESFRIHFSNRFEILGMGKSYIPVLGKSISYWLGRDSLDSFGWFSVACLPLQLPVDLLGKHSPAMVIVLGERNE
jgi:hypothetical protein